MCRQRAGFLPGQYRPAVASDAGSSRAPFRPPRPIMSTALSGAGAEQPNTAGVSLQHPTALSQPARGLGQYSAEVAVGVSEPLCEILEASAQPALNAAGQLERLADERLAGNASQLQQQHDWSQGPHEPDTHDLSGQPIYGSPISEQLRAPGTHMRVRRSPQLEEAAAQDSQATQTAEHSSGALPAEQLLPPNMHGLFSIEEADLSGVRPEGLDAPDASAPHHEASRPDIQPPEPGLHSAGELSAAELSAAERSAAERRRQSRHFVAQVARESAALQAALASSTSSSDPSVQQARAGNDEQPAAADEEMCSPDSSPAEEAPADARRPDEASLAAWHGAAAPEEQNTMVRAEAPQGLPAELLQQKRLESPLASAQLPQQAALSSQPEQAMPCTDTTAMQANGPSMPTASSPAESGNEPDIVVDLSSPSPVMQQPAVQSQGASQQHTAASHGRHAQSSSDGSGTQPRASQPSQPVSRSAPSPQQRKVGLQLEVRSDHQASPVRLSLNLDLTDSSKQTPANGSSQSAVPEHRSPKNILHTELSEHAPSQPVSVHSLSKDPSQLQHSSAAGEATSMASPQEAHANQQTPAAAQHEGLQLTDVPLSALHPRGLFMTQAVGAAAGATPMLLVSRHGQQPNHASTHDRDGTYGMPQTGGHSQDGVDRHSGHSAPTAQSQPMHARNHRQPDILDMETGSPCSPDTAHEAVCLEGGGTELELPQQRRQDEDSNEAILHAFKPCRRPPTRQELQASMQELGILGIQHQGAFYGKPADVPERPIGMSLQPTTV